MLKNNTGIKKYCPNRSAKSIKNCKTVFCVPLVIGIKSATSIPIEEPIMYFIQIFMQKA